MCFMRFVTIQRSAMIDKQVVRHHQRINKNFTYTELDAAMSKHIADIQFTLAEIEKVL